MFSIRLCDVSPVIWMLLVPLARSELGSRISLSVSGWRDVGTERFSTVTMLGAGGGLGTISAIWGVQVGGGGGGAGGAAHTVAGHGVTRAPEEAVVVEHLVGQVEPSVEAALLRVVTDRLTFRLRLHLLLQ